VPSSLSSNGPGLRQELDGSIAALLYRPKAQFMRVSQNCVPAVSKEL
jgi:hypothetical protein